MKNSIDREVNNPPPFFFKIMFYKETNEHDLTYKQLNLFGKECCRVRLPVYEAG